MVKHRMYRPVLACLALLLVWAAAGCRAGVVPGDAGAHPGTAAPTLLARYIQPSATPQPIGGGAGLRLTVEPPRLLPTPRALAVTALPSSSPPPANPTALLTATPPPPLTICSPLQNVGLQYLERVVSSPYKPPPQGSDQRHHGVDFAYYHWDDTGPIAGTEARSILPGRVATALNGTFPFGTLVIIETPLEWLTQDLKDALEIPDGKSLYHLYAHMEDGSLQVAVGDWVQACQPVGLIGHSGNTQATHLHLETRHGPPGVTFLKFAAFTTVTPDERANYIRWRIGGEFVHFDPLRLFLYGLHTGGG